MGFFLRCSLPYHKNPGWEWPTVGEHLVPPQVSKPPMDCWTLVRSVARRANLLRSRSGSPAATSHGTQRWWRLMARANCLRWEEALPGTSSSLLLHWCRSFLGWRVGGIERWLMTSMVFPVKFFSPWAENLYHLGILPRIPNGSIGNWFWSRIRMSFWTLWGTAWRRRGERWRVGECRVFVEKNGSFRFWFCHFQYFYPWWCGLWTTFCQLTLNLPPLSQRRFPKPWMWAAALDGKRFCWPPVAGRCGSDDGKIHMQVVSETFSELRCVCLLQEGLWCRTWVL